MCRLFYLVLLLCLRIGEASHPGPPENCCVIGIANPSGINNKAELCLTLDRGIRFSKAMKALQPPNRNLALLHGAFAAPRAGSTFAGAWTGVCQFSDFPMRAMHVPWRGFEYESGRSMISVFQLGAHSVLGATLYAPPSGPTYGNAKGLTAELLDTITEELVLGASGPRFVAGDFNLGSSDLEAFHHWRSLGWMECQGLALLRFGRAPTPTCKHSTAPDHLWLSPELQAWVLQVDSSDLVFPDHATLQATIQIPDLCNWSYRWFQPAVLPWATLDIDLSTLDFGLQPDHTWDRHDLTQSFCCWSTQAESELLHGLAPHVPIHNGFIGRGSTIEVQKKKVSFFLRQTW